MLRRFFSKFRSSKLSSEGAGFIVTGRGQGLGSTDAERSKVNAAEEIKELQKAIEKPKMILMELMEKI